MITTRPEHCWIVTFPNSDVWEEPHFSCEADVRSEVDDRNEGELELYGVRQLDHLCVKVACNECKKDLGDDDFAVTHYPDVAMAAEMAREAGFFVHGTDAWCDSCQADRHPETTGGTA